MIIEKNACSYLSSRSSLSWCPCGSVSNSNPEDTPIILCISEVKPKILATCPKVEKKRLLLSVVAFFFSARLCLCAYVCMCLSVATFVHFPSGYLCARTVQSNMVMCFAAVLASTSASSSLTLFSTDISRGLFSAGIRQDSYLRRSDYAALENKRNRDRTEAQARNAFGLIQWSSCISSCGNRE